MKLQIVLLGLCLSIALFTFPAYGEVMSLHSDKSSYFKGEKIIFSGTAESTDSGNPVYIEITGPQGSYVDTYNNQTNTDGSFQIIVDTNNTQIQSKFSSKGTYSAVAFIHTRTLSSSVKFDYTTEPQVFRPAFITQPQNTTHVSNQSVITPNIQSSINENKMEVTTNSSSTPTIISNPQKPVQNTESLQPTNQQQTNQNSSGRCSNLSPADTKKCLDSYMYNVALPAYRAQQAQQTVCLHHNPDGSCQVGMSSQDYEKAQQEQQQSTINTLIISAVLLVVVIGIVGIAISRRRKRTVPKEASKSGSNKDIRKPDDKEWKGV